MSVDWSALAQGGAAVGTLALAFMGYRQMRSTDRRMRQAELLEMEEPIFTPLLKELKPLAGEPTTTFPSAYLGGGPSLLSWHEAQREAPSLAMRLPEHVRSNLDAAARWLERYMRSTQGVWMDVKEDFLAALGSDPKSDTFDVRIVHFSKKQERHRGLHDPIHPTDILCFYAMGGTVQEWISSLKSKSYAEGPTIGLERPRDENVELSRDAEAEAALEAAWNVVVAHPNATQARDAMQHVQQEARKALDYIINQMASLA